MAARFVEGYPHLGRTLASPTTSFLASGGIHYSKVIPPALYEPKAPPSDFQSGGYPGRRPTPIRLLHRGTGLLPVAWALSYLSLGAPFQWRRSPTTYSSFRRYSGISARSLSSRPRSSPLMTTLQLHRFAARKSLSRRFEQDGRRVLCDGADFGTDGRRAEPE